MKIYDAVFVYLLITSNKCHKLPSCAYCQLWTFFACKTFHSIQHSLYKTSIFHISWFLTLFFLIVLWLQQICKILKATARLWKNGFFFGKFLFLTLTSSNSKGSFAIALKFLRQAHWFNKEEKCVATCKIMNINVGFRIFVNASHSVFLRKH